MATIVEKRRRLKMIVDTARYRERIRVTNEFTRLLEKQKRDFLKIIRDEKKIREKEICGIESQYKQKMRDELRTAIEKKERELFSLKKELYQLRKQNKENKKAYLMYREYVDYLKRMSDDLSLGIKRVLMDFSNSYQMIETTRDKIEFHERHMRKIDPAIRKLLKIHEDEELDSRDIDVTIMDAK